MRASKSTGSFGALLLSKSRQRERERESEPGDERKWPTTRADYDFLEACGTGVRCGAGGGG